MNPMQLKQIRAALGWSQQRLADEMGVARNTVNRWEMGERRITAMAEKLLKTLSRECHSAAAYPPPKKR